MDNEDLKAFIVELINEEFGPSPCELAPRWMGGVVKLEPGNDSSSKEFPVEIFYKKILSVRDSLRVLEQKINNNSHLPAADKVNFHSYITKAYGSLTTFNIMFKDGKDRFQGSGGSGSGSKSKEKISITEAKKKLGLNEY